MSSGFTVVIPEVAAGREAHDRPFRHDRSIFGTTAELPR
jgi:hypothetical protein